MKNFKISTGIFLALVCACAPVSYHESEVSYKIWHDCCSDCMPDFDTLGAPSLTGVLPVFDIEGHSDFSGEHYAAVFTSTLDIDKADDFTFYLKSDDGSRLYIDGNLLIDRSEVRGRANVSDIKLEAGRHSIRAEYFQNCESERMRVSIGHSDELLHCFGDNSAPADKTPDFVMSQAAETFERYCRWKGEDETVTFPILTDIHSHERYSYQHIGYAAMTDNLFHYDFMTCLGDIGLNVGPGHCSRKYSEKVVRFTLSEMEKYDGVFLYSVGNHDWDAGEGEFYSNEFYSENFQRRSAKYAPDNFHFVDGKAYYCYDIPAKDVRVVILNSESSRTQAPAYYLFDDEQLNWLCSVLDETSPSTAVVVMSHYMPHPVGRWHNEPAPLTKESNEKLMSVLSHYKATRNIVGLFCGDSHFNVCVKQDGVNYYVSQGYGGVRRKDMMDGTRYARFDYKKSMCCDVVSIKPAKHEVRSFRIGAGGEDFDNSFSY